MKILICDDEEARAKEWEEKIEEIGLGKGNSVSAMTKTQAQAEIGALEKRRVLLRNGGDLTNEVCLFDQADIVIVDYDLLGLSENGDFITGDKVAYLVHLLSSVKYVVVVNQFGLNEFDLSLMRDAKAKADLNVGDAWLHNRGLWKETFKGFRPWAWPLLLDEPAKQQARIAELGQDNALDSAILGYLSFDDHAIATLSSAALEYISRGAQLADANSPKQVTFRQFVLNSGNVLERKDAEVLRQRPNDAAITRLAAAAIYKWLDRQVLVSQDVLVDAPHLVERMPQFITDSGNPLKAFNATTSLMNPRGMTRDIEQFAFAKRAWLSRKAFWGIPIEKNEEFFKLPRKVKNADFAFCEDTSQFAALDKCREFVAEIPSVYSRRHISAADGSGDVTYTPAFRLAI